MALPLLSPTQPPNPLRTTGGWGKLLEYATAAGCSFTGKSSSCLPALRFTELDALILELNPKLVITYTTHKETI